MKKRRRKNGEIRSREGKAQRAKVKPAQEEEGGRRQAEEK